MANKVYSTEFQRLLREKDEEICSLKKIIEHQDAIIDFVDRKMQEIRLGNEKLFLRNQELEAFYKANSPKNLFQKQPKSPIVMEKVSERLSTNHEMMNKDCADRKKDTQRTLVKDAKKNSREGCKEREQNNNMVPQSSGITGPRITPTDASHSAGLPNSTTRLPSFNICERFRRRHCLLLITSMLSLARFSINPMDLRPPTTPKSGTERRTDGALII
ncbi:hypothetical protein L5515_017146 [Caenorhabditis briggsae]|uniref:Uncharacterized protein n=1 Tax=Caenorhabditis briggsae TaxID=6238 RepID=A0AAE9JQG4_CAEBR|nr:hypothetical protein L5515_017146 [Caenorhabditis briggsae]